MPSPLSCFGGGCDDSCRHLLLHPKVGESVTQKEVSILVSSLEITVPGLLSHDEKVTCGQFLFLTGARREYGSVDKVLGVLSLDPITHLKS